MKNKDIRKQHNNFSQAFSFNQEMQNQVNRTIMYSFVGGDLSNKKVLDLACGDGVDAQYYKKIGGDVSAIDASKGLISIAKEKYPEVDFCVGLAEELSYGDEVFDCVFSKYAIMTSADMKPIFDEVYRVLKPGGEFIYLVTHPFRQFLERKNVEADYFSQTNVTSVILDATVEVVEPTHTMNEYLNEDFFSKYELLDFQESFDPAAEKIKGAKYPGFFIIKARKK